MLTGGKWPPIKCAWRSRWQSGNSTGGTSRVMLKLQPIVASFGRWSKHEPPLGHGNSTPWLAWFHFPAHRPDPSPPGLISGNALPLLSVPEQPGALWALQEAGCAGIHDPPPCRNRSSRPYASGLAGFGVHRGILNHLLCTCAGRPVPSVRPIGSSGKIPTIPAPIGYSTPLWETNGRALPGRKRLERG